MDFAFPALAILALSFPGIFFILGYRYNSGSIQDSVNTLGDISKAVAIGSLFALLIHLAVIPLLPYLPFALPVDRTMVCEFLQGEEKSPEHEKAVENVANHFARISAYILLTSCLGLALGAILRKIVKKFFLDVKYEFLRMESSWEYFFNGSEDALSILQLHSGKVKYVEIWRLLSKNEVSCYVSLLINAGGPPSVINGVVEDYEITPEGKLEKLILSQVSRMKLPKCKIDVMDLMGKDEEEMEELHPELEYVEIPGSQFIVPYNTVKNLNSVFLYTERHKPQSFLQKQLKWFRMPSDGLVTILWRRFRS